jgi:hypothetical protein
MKPMMVLALVCAMRSRANLMTRNVQSFLERYVTHKASGILPASPRLKMQHNLVQQPSGMILQPLTGSEAF